MLGPAAAALLARLLTGPRPIDDAYITFRYARNLADGLGLVYNPGEWVLGTSTPLWALVLALADRLGSDDLPLVAATIASACDAITAAVLTRLSVQLGFTARAAALVGLGWALNPMSLAFAVGGMETSLFVLAMISSLALAASGRPERVRGAAILAGVSALVRPEGLLVGTVVAGWTSLVRRRELPFVLVAAWAPALAGGALLFVRYGSPLPHSLVAKQVAYQSSSPFENLLALLVQSGLPGWSTYLLAVVPASAGLVLAAAGAACLACLTVHGLRGGAAAAGRQWQPFAGMAMLLLTFYTLAGLRGARLFPWYLVALEPLYLLGAAAGLARLAPLARLPGAVLAALVVAWQLPAMDSRQGLLPLGYPSGREEVLLEAGRLVRATLPPTAVVAAPEIGALGYASRVRILDTVGLVSPAALAYYPLPPDQLVVDNAIPAGLILDARPDMVVTLAAFAERSLLGDPTFDRQYRLELAVPVHVWESSRLLMFRRVDDSTGSP
ncbi:MAG: hypothetical protein M3336_07565 [Chloroflexota bacterium]|nr:hypothetical protein [Chloroflexota bacterium]